MEYTSLFQPVFCVFLSVLLGVIIGCLITAYLISKEQKELKNELDKFRGLYSKELKKWKDKYTDDGYEAY
jgi:uncharacterized membrane protein YgaE (UPF0421/DUF939 family)